MKTMPECISEVYETAIRNVMKRIEKRGYITLLEVCNFYAELLNAFFADYKGMEPLTDDFEDYLEREFFRRLESIEGLKKREFPELEDWKTECPFPATVIYGFDERRIEEGYEELMRKGVKAFLRELEGELKRGLFFEQPI